METQDLEKSFNAAVANFMATSKKIEERLTLLQQKETQWAQLKCTMKENSIKAKSKIVLDVGGTQFTTAKQTLLSLKGTYFDAMLSSGNWQPDDDGSYFIDRDPKHFATILNYLRMKEIDLEGWNKKDLETLQKELDYYGITLPQGAPPSPSSDLID